jgi:hypothetical protein
MRVKFPEIEAKAQSKMLLDCTVEELQGYE